MKRRKTREPCHAELPCSGVMFGKRVIACLQLKLLALSNLLMTQMALKEVQGFIFDGLTARNRS